MINIGIVPFIIIVQIIIVLVLLTATLFYLLKIKNRKLNTLLLESQHKEEVSPTASIKHYFTAEIKLTESRFNALYKDQDLQNITFLEPDWLKLRKDYLEVEIELLASDEREDAFWLVLGKKIKSLLNGNQLVKRLKTKDVEDEDEEEIKEMKQLLKSQHDDFDDLILKLDGDKSAAEIAELNDKLTRIVRSHTELSSCVFVLEDENMFLRDQISSLLKVS